MDSQTPVIQLKGIGEKTEKLFQKINIHTVGDLIRDYPKNYDTMEAPVPVSKAHPGEVCAVHAMVAGIPNLKKIRNLQVLNVMIRDETGGMQLTFFNMPYLKNVLKSGGYYIFRGLVQTRGSEKVMEQPKIFSEEEYTGQMKFIQPCYSLTKGLTNQAVRKAVKQALTFYGFDEEYYPSAITGRYGLIPYKEAVCDIHFPLDRDKLLQARRRIVFDEFFDFLFLLRRNKDFTQALPNEYVLEETPEINAFLGKLPFRLTHAQENVWKEVWEDLSGNLCMNRLIQGDVGSGKTIVAILALLLCAENGYQGAMMAPTEVLAMQHYQSILEYTDRYQLSFRPVLLTGSLTARERKDAYEKIENGTANLILGTQAVIQEKVKFRSLALVVTDEQHRFGVRQRESLAQKGYNPHVLVMSATPIPRTLAIILYGDLHISVIDELPADRLPIKNCVVNTSYRPKAYDFITREVANRRQTYVICPMVEEGEMEDAENVLEYTQKLKALLPSSVRVASLHGKMRPADKKQIMEEFAAHSIDVLVSTTVIEVGINVPNATVMMVENAERFGLAQLHQLRGRVGRGNHQSYCIFMSTSEKKETMERLGILNKSNDGFYIASEDLKLRGPGDLFGIRQSGEFSFQVGDIYNDAAILKQASEAVEELLAEDATLTMEKNSALCRHFLAAAGNGVDFRSI